MTKRSKKNKNSVKQKSIEVNPVKERPDEVVLDQGFWKKNWWVALALLLGAVGIYFQSTSYGYILDDQIVIEDNSFTKQGFAGIDDILSTESMTGYFGEQKNLVQGNRYRPLSIVTFAMEYGLLGGLNPTVSHWINILLYGLSIILLMRLCHLLFRNHTSLNQGAWMLSLGVAILFLVHPIHVEAVANIKGRDEIMALLFSLLSILYAYKADLKANKWNLLLANLMFFLGLLSKENTITILAIIPLTLYFFNQRDLLHSIKNLSSFLITTVVYLVLRFWASGVPELGKEAPDLMNNPFLGMSVVERFSTIMYTLGWYIKLLFIPYPLTHDYYPYTVPIMDLSDWQVWTSILIYVAMIGVAFKHFKQRKLFSYSILFYLASLSIVSNVVINLGTFMNDRFVYMPSVGYCLVLVGALYFLKQKLGNKYVFYGALGAISLIYAIISFTRVPDWESPMTLNKSALKVSYNSARANTFMSTALFNQGKNEEDRTRKLQIMEEALPYAIKSVEIHPTYYNGNLMLAGISSEVFKINNEVQPLMNAFEKIITRRPDVKYVTEFIEYIKGRPNVTPALNAMIKRSAEALLNRNNQHDPGWAIKYLNYAYETAPNDKAINQLLGRAYQMRGDANRANTYLNRAKALQ